MSVIKKGITVLGTLIVFVIIADMALVLGISQYRPSFDHADAAVILGAAIYSPALTHRTLQGLSLYESGRVDRLILSGGRISDKDISEAGYMKQVIHTNAKASVPYTIEDRSSNTFENIHNAHDKLPRVKSVVIVSDEFHLARGVLLALREGYYPVYWTSPQPTYYSKNELTWYYVREMVAMIAYIPHFITNK